MKQWDDKMENRGEGLETKGIPYQHISGSKKKKKHHGVHTSSTSKEHVEKVLGRHFFTMSAMGVCESSAMVMVSCRVGSIIVDARTLSFIRSMLIEDSSLLWIAQNGEGLGDNYQIKRDKDEIGCQR